MFKNSPLFLSQVSTLLGYSLIFSFLGTFFATLAAPELSNDGITTNVLIGLYVFFGAIYFLLIFLCCKRKNAARVILIILLILGIVGGVGSIFIEDYSLVELGTTILSCILDVYALILLFSAPAQRYFSQPTFNQNNEPYKAWVSTLTGLLMLCMFGVKYLNKYDMEHRSQQSVEQVEQHYEPSLDEVLAEDPTTEASVAESDMHEAAQMVEFAQNQIDESPYFEKLNCADPVVINDFTEAVNGSPMALNLNLRVVDVDTDFVEEISFSSQPYDLQCSVRFTLNNSSDIDYVMRVYDKNGKGKLMIEGTPVEVDAW